MKKTILTLSIIILSAISVIAQDSNIKKLSADLKGEAVIEALQKTYKGKVIVMDMWATWCPPCRKAMSTIKPLKAEMKGKDVVFIYLANSSSPLKTWEEMVKDISGDHYYLKDEQWKYVFNKYGQGGIPLYVIFNKEGVKKSSYSGFPGNETLKKSINENLK